ncbi:MAG: indolepyruvate ferredoxin oxidoreductase subunit alpha [Deltaproteobacteria bacterium]|nr:indolepyruvate ferredoxin oxidoreductase subunit alpha [Deltaproteobacteria bacterium]
MDKDYRILMGNEAIGRGILEGGAKMATSYPGTPASEILSSVAKFSIEENVSCHIEWSINEKVAYEVALTNSYSGKRSAVSMKQVGLNVAMDPFMSSAYIGVKGGFVLISADDPGPYSSQTEQDSRFLAMFAKVPVFDPTTPTEAKEMVINAFDFSEKYEIPVMVRPTNRICHARQKVPCYDIPQRVEEANFEKNPPRWAATPRFRYQLHKELNKKIHEISKEITYTPFNSGYLLSNSKEAIVASGAAFSHIYDILEDIDLLDKIPLYQIKMPFPINNTEMRRLISKYNRILVCEETYPVIEMQMANLKKVRGRRSGDIPSEGELTPDILYSSLRKFLRLPKTKKRKTPPRTKEKRPSLCPGCPHRASFFGIRKALPKGIYTSDIGCYTLGMNMGVVDTVLCMGAAITQATGFYHSYKNSNQDPPPIVATIGDSTFYHMGPAGLTNAVFYDAKFVLVIMDNSTTAMTGNQPTPETGIYPDGTKGKSISLEELIKGCGVKWIKEIDPYQLPEFIKTVKEAHNYCRSPKGGVAVIISKHPCLVDKRSEKKWPKYLVEIDDECTGCKFCIEKFECPALIFDEKNEKVKIDYNICTGCGICAEVCPTEHIHIKKEL